MNTPPLPSAHERTADVYLQKINALVAANREHLIADITAEYTATIDQSSEHDEYTAA